MDKNGDGIISADEVSSALGESGLSVGSQSLEDLIAADVPGSKCLTFDDFRVCAAALAPCWNLIQALQLSFDAYKHHPLK